MASDMRHLNVKVEDEVTGRKPVLSTGSRTLCVSEDGRQEQEPERARLVTVKGKNKSEPITGLKALFSHTLEEITAHPLVDSSSALHTTRAALASITNLPYLSLDSLGTLASRILKRWLQDPCPLPADFIIPCEAETTAAHQTTAKRCGNPQSLSASLDDGWELAVCHRCRDPQC